MTLTQRVDDLATRVGQEFNAVRSEVASSSEPRTASVTTGTLAADASTQTTMALTPVATVYHLNASSACRVRIYASADKQAADLSRSIGTDPVGDHGCLLDAVLNAEVLSLSLSPVAVLIGAATGSYPITITNLDAASQAVTVTVSYTATGPALAGFGLLAGLARTVIVTTGSEPRPAADVVLWVSHGGVSPTNAIETDIVFLPSSGGTTSDTTAPASPSNIVASNVTSTGFTLSWTAALDNVGVTGYEVEVGGASRGTTANTTFSVTGLDPATTYSVRVRARDAAANYSGWASLPGGVATSAGSGVLFLDDFERPDGPDTNGWVNWDETIPNISSGRLVAAGWGAYARLRHGGIPREARVEATFESTIDVYQGVFLAWSPTTGTGIKFFNNGGQWVVGNAANFFMENTNVNGVPLGTTRIALAFDGTNVTAWAGDTQVFQAPFASLGIAALDTAPGNVYYFGYCGEAKYPYMNVIEVTSP